MNTLKNGTETIRAMTRSELAAKYRVCINTLNNWLKEFSPELRLSKKKVLTPAQVKLIFEKIGEP